MTDKLVHYRVPSDNYYKETACGRLLWTGGGRDLKASDNMEHVTCLVCKNMLAQKGKVKIPIKICLFCQYFVFDTGEQGYSEYTPTVDAEIFCKKGHWRVEMHNDGEEIYRRQMLTAQTCEDWQLTNAVDYLEE